MKKTALITGASSGIGKELAYIHAKRGGHLILVARRKHRLDQIKEELEEQYGITVMVLAEDLSQEGASRRIYDAVKDAGAEVDYLINNAGFGGRGMFHQRSWERDHAMITVNVVALAALSRLFLPDFVARNSGRILNVSSVASLVPGPLHAVYYATKAFVTSFSNALNEELYDTNITVTNLMPGATKTEFGKSSKMDKVGLFQNPVPALGVAENGYNAMLAGKLNLIAGLTSSQKFMMSMLPFVPKRFVLKQIRKAHKLRAQG